MNHQPNPMNKQAAAYAVLSALTQTHGHLPAPYVTVHTYGTTTVDLQLNTPQEFEAWRSALLVPTESVDIKSGSGRSWLAANAVFHGVALRLAGDCAAIVAEPSAVAA